MPSDPSVSKAAEAIREKAKIEGATIILDSKPDSDSVKIGTPYTWEPKNKVLEIITVNVKKMPAADKKVIFAVIRELHEDGHLIFKGARTPLYDSYSKYIATNPNNKLLAFFKEILSPDDYSALKMSLFIENLAKQNINIHSFKRDIREKFGSRGAHISNLCSANYFKDVFMPLFNDSSRAEFDKHYDLAVGKKASALFIHSRMTINQMEKEVNIMVEKAIRYHLGGFRIHGMGKINIETIKKFIGNRDIEKDGYVTIKVHNDVDNVLEYSIVIVD